MLVCPWVFVVVEDAFADIIGHIIIPIMFLPVIECIDWHICTMLLGVAAIGSKEASCSAVSFDFTCSWVAAAIASKSFA